MDKSIGKGLRYARLRKKRMAYSHSLREHFHTATQKFYLEFSRHLYVRLLSMQSRFGTHQRLGISRLSKKFRGEHYDLSQIKDTCLMKRSFKHWDYQRWRQEDDEGISYRCSKSWMASAFLKSTTSSATFRTDTSSKQEVTPTII